MFSVRDDYQKDLWGTLRQIKTMGYDAVEFFGGFAYTAQELKAALDETGLVCCGWHTSYYALKPDQIVGTVTYNKVIGNTDLVIPWIPAEMYDSKESCLKTAKEFDEIAAKLAGYGMYLGYHNHNSEFSEVDGDWPMHHLFDNSERLTFQLDNGNAWSAGTHVDIYRLMERYQSRARTVHLKPWSLTSGYSTMIGQDDIDWPRFVRICKQRRNIKWFIVEYECKDLHEPMEGIRLCLENLKSMEREGKFA